MKNKKGFTLVELLVAATIIGALAVFATINYRQSAAESRWVAAKARADMLWGAMQRFMLDYGIDYTYSVGNDGIMTDLGVSEDRTCPMRPGFDTPSKTVYPQWLIKCGYLENGGWSDSTWIYSLCDPGGCDIGEVYMWPKQEAKFPSTYARKMYAIGTDGQAGEEPVPY